MVGCPCTSDKPKLNDLFECQGHQMCNQIHYFCYVFGGQVFKQRCQGVSLANTLHVKEQDQVTPKLYEKVTQYSDRQLAGHSGRGEYHLSKVHGLVRFE